MKKHTKNAIGLAGLGLVIGMTAVAANLPDAAATSSYTETVTVRVVGDVAALNINFPTDGLIITNPSLQAQFDYENIETLSATLSYTSSADSSISATIDITDLLTNTNVDYNAGSDSFNLDIASLNPTNITNISNPALYPDFKFSYGDYILTITGHNSASGDVDQKIVKFSYKSAAINTSDSDNTNGGDPSVTIDDVSDDVDKITICVPALDNYCKEVNPDDTNFPTNIGLPFDDYGLPEGDYEVIITSYNKDGNIIDITTSKVHYKPTIVATVGIPDTGSVLETLNLSRTDYLLTGLVIFFGFVGFSIYFIARHEKSKR